MQRRIWTQSWGLSSSAMAMPRVLFILSFVTREGAGRCHRVRGWAEQEVLVQWCKKRVEYP